jgi:hypothetical protein
VILKTQASQCGNQMDTRFWGCFFEELGIGVHGEYCGDNDAQLGCISDFLAPHTNEPRDVPRLWGSEFTIKIAPQGKIQLISLLG